MAGNPVRWLARQVDAFATAEPMPGVSYDEVLDADQGPFVPRYRKALRASAGVMLGVLTFAVLFPLVGMGLMALAWTLSGSPGEFTAFRDAAIAFENPQGMLVAHLTLALLIPLSMALVLVVHRTHPRWLHSVQPGVRWRLLLAFLLVAAVVLNAVMLLSMAGQALGLRPQPEFWAFLPVILLTSPLQAAAEEYFFRGYLIQAIHPMAPRSPWFGVVGAAALFALLHGTQNLPLFLDRFGFGVLAGVLVVKTGGLEAAIAAHTINNVFAFVYAGLTSTIDQVKATQVIGWSEAAWDLAGFAAYTLAAIWLARRMRAATTTPGTRPPEALPA